MSSRSLNSASMLNKERLDGLAIAASMKNGNEAIWGFVRLKGKHAEVALILFAYLIMKYFVIRQLVIYRTLITTISSACRGWAWRPCGTQPTCR
jgi:hypothetical protein